MIFPPRRSQGACVRAAAGEHAGDDDAPPLDELGLARLPPPGMRPDPPVELVHAPRSAATDVPNTLAGLYDPDAGGCVRRPHTARPRRPQEPPSRRRPPLLLRLASRPPRREPTSKWGRSILVSVCLVHLHLCRSGGRDATEHIFFSLRKYATEHMDY